MLVKSISCKGYCSRGLACRVTNKGCSKSGSCTLECYQDSCANSPSGCPGVPSPPTCRDLKCPTGTECKNIGLGCNPSCSGQFYGCIALADIDGYCPDTSFMYPTRSNCEIMDLNNCNEDRNCPKQKCCKTLCGKRCLDPIGTTIGISGACSPNLGNLADRETYRQPDRQTEPPCQDVFQKCPTTANNCIQNGGTLELDSNGCELCLCSNTNNNPCASKTCSAGYSCKADCSKGPCFTWCQQTCTPFPCLKTMFCQNGFLKDAEGCDICKCDPTAPPKDCTVLTCGSGEVCKMTPLLCSNPPCRERPKCVDNVKNGTCPADTNTNRCFTRRDNCTYDENCPYLQKCCTRRCGKQCVDPVDDNGCPMQICPTNISQCTYGQAKDNKGCQICECNDPCKSKSCGDGKTCAVVSSNCGSGVCTYTAICQCAFDPAQCPQTCSYGYAQNSTSGCYICTCLPDPCTNMCPVNQRCEIANDRDCPDGVVNKDLCPAKARCVNCSNTDCTLTCGGQSTKKIGTDGCPACLCDGCQAQSCSTVCSGQYKQTTGSDGCLICQCQDSGSSGCPSLNCNNTCPSGRETDDQGCDICQCASLCKSYSCPTGQTCRVISDSQVICEDPSGSSLQCPVHNTDGQLNANCYKMTSCKTDSDCGSNKCCLLQCGYRCTPPVNLDPTTVVIHPGVCPKNPVDFPCYRYRFVCKSDVDCKSEKEKCCLRGCNRLCIRALQTATKSNTFRSGYCKFPEERWGSVLRKYFKQGKHICQSNSDCPGDNMCCLLVDGKTHTVARKCLAPETQDWTDGKYSF
ncbi:hypothetical protein LSH36_733g00037 [Paralvinella palmiformis]|uniref:Uncharacterized protein n=1 Tax=Paralvinella palmiformis TaxID=53620 RepID=A0AAD9MUN0_9ANNE|nr:hypothetical protein LSH36_733g00037 [Paralvinella palmiformis]